MKIQDHNKRIIVDLDDCLCFTTNREFSSATPNDVLIDKLNLLYEKGFEICILTARGQVSCNGSAVAAEKKYGKQIRTWLKQNHVKYTELSFEKKLGIYYIDDKGILPEDFVQLDIEDMYGLSGASITRYGDVVCKIQKSVESAMNVIKWYDVAKWILPTPKILSVIDSTIKMEFIPTLDNVFNINDMLQYIQIMKNTDPLSGTNVDCRSYMDRILEHMKLSVFFTTEDKELIVDIFNLTAEYLNRSTSFSHGDYSLDNCLFHPDKQITYLIDPIYLPNVWSSYLQDFGKLAHSCRKHQHFEYLDLIYKYVEHKNIPVFVILFMEVCQWIRILKYCEQHERLIYASATRILLTQLKKSYDEQFT